jgi:hypothetical protein
MEGFVLGGAILLHDAALCFEAYAEGKDGVRNTLEWRDCYAAEQDRHPGASDAASRAAADFAALRVLHAKQAAELAEMSWTAPNGSALFLIDDSELRQRYGRWIGLIAASHHWPIEDVGSKLEGQINAPGAFPLEWRVDAVKVACLLRCADAAHIDSRRAPDFLYALLRRQGFSAEHWKAQNWLARADTDQLETSGTSLVITSNRSFGPNDVEAWWIAFDAICVIATEISASNRLLESRPQREASPPFKIRSVSGVSSPEAMSERVRVDRWQPCSANIHVGNVEELIKSLGGTNLYGDSHGLAVGLRELIQNARDAVAARRALDPEYSGKIRIEIRMLEDEETHLEIHDDGVGMSERVLLGPLLDFGMSFWSSDLVQQEFPGLRSTQFRSVGRFGIGFYSIFMIASSATISSRRWDAGLDDIRTLAFPNGLTLRPTLITGRAEGFGAYTSTKVSCRLKSEFRGLLAMTIKPGRLGQSDFNVRLSDFLAVLVAGLDVHVEFRGPEDREFQEVHKPVEVAQKDSARQDWLERISFAMYPESRTAIEELETYARRLRFLKEGDHVVGLATLSTHPPKPTADFLSVTTVGGLAQNAQGGRDSSKFVGYMDYSAKSAKRDIGSIRATKETLKAWADEQIVLLRKEKVTPAEWCSATYSLSELDLDPTSITHVLVLVNGTLTIMTLPEVFELTKVDKLAVLKSSFLDHIETHVGLVPFRNYPTFVPLRNSSFLSLERNRGVPRRETSFIGCLYRYAASQGCRLQFEDGPLVTKSFLGPVYALVLTVS